MSRRADGYLRWSRLRQTPDGWRVLGERPPASEADMGAVLVTILRALADDSSEEEAKPLRRAAGSIGRSHEALSSTSPILRSTERVAISRHERLDGPRRGRAVLAAREPDVRRDWFKRP